VSDENQQTTLRETLEAAVAEHSEPIVSESEPVEQKTERVRDDTGKFASKETKKVELQPVEAPTEQPEIKEFQRPSSWKKEMWPLWDKLTTGAALSPQEARQLAEYNVSREQQFATGVSTYKSEADRLRPLEQEYTQAKPLLDAVAPFKADLDRYGLQAPQMIQALLAGHRTLSIGSPQDKLNAFVKFANEYGVPIEALYDQNARNQFFNSRPNIPQPAQAPQQPQDYYKIVNEVLTTREATQTISQMERNTEKYPFFQYVRPTMAQLLETGATADLDEAYQMALEAPEHSRLTSFMQQQQEQVNEQRKLEAQQKVVKAARANTVSVKSATPMSGSGDSKPSVRGALMEALEAHRTGAKV